MIYADQGWKKQVVFVEYNNWLLFPLFFASWHVTPEELDQWAAYQAWRDNGLLSKFASMALMFTDHPYATEQTRWL